jgi:hypothetical protein
MDQVKAVFGRDFTGLRELARGMGAKDDFPSSGKAASSDIGQACPKWDEETLCAPCGCEVSSISLPNAAALPENIPVAMFVRQARLERSGRRAPGTND